MTGNAQVSDVAVALTPAFALFVVPDVAIVATLPQLVTLPQPYPAVKVGVSGHYEKWGSRTFNCGGRGGNGAPQEPWGGQTSILWGL